MIDYFLLRCILSSDHLMRMLEFTPQALRVNLSLNILFNIIFLCLLDAKKNENEIQTTLIYI